MIKFITGNPEKLREAASIIGEIELLNIDLPEIQEMDPRKIIEAKLTEAQKHHEGEYIVEDTSLSCEALNGLPGPLIKWFSKAIGNKKLSEIVHYMGNNKATAITMIGYIDSSKHIEYFSGELHGEIVAPKGEGGFGWDPIFKPLGHQKTFAEMSESDKNKISMRKKALIDLKRFLDEKI